MASVAARRHCLAVVTAARFRAWSDTYLGHGQPFEHAGRLWICTSVCYPALDRFGYSPPALLQAVEVVPEEEWPEGSFSTGAPGIRGHRVRIGHATKGQPYVFTGRLLIASENCGKPTEHSPGGSIHEPLEDFEELESA